MGAMVLGLVGVVVRAEGRAVGRVLLGTGDAGVSAPLGHGRATHAVRRGADVRKQPVSGSAAEVEI